MVPENCSRRHLTVTFVPTLIGSCNRTQAPKADVSSSIPGATCGVPAKSTQNASARAMIAVLLSIRFSMNAISVKDTPADKAGHPGRDSAERVTRNVFRA
jgi:hypothetical protein